MTRRALGRGLSALLSDRPAIPNEEFVELDLDLIETSGYQPRAIFREDKLEELAQSIKTNGILQPILVRKIEGDRYQLIAGERRWRAAQRAGLLRIPCIVREIPDEKMLELALIENIQREELNPIEEALAYRRLMEASGFTHEMVAQKVGRDRTFITNHLRLLRLPEDVQLLVEDEKLTMGHARALLGIDEPETQKTLANKIIEQQWSVRETEKVIKRYVNRETAETEEADSGLKKAEDANIRFAEDKLRKKLSSKVQILINQNNKGKIQIEFYDANDLNRIYEIIMGKGGEAVSA